MRYSSMDHLRPIGLPARMQLMLLLLGTSEQRILLAAPQRRVGPTFVLVPMEAWRVTLPRFAQRSFITGDKKSCIGNLGQPQHPQESKLEIYCRYQRVGHLEKITHKYEQWEQHLCSIPNYRTFAAHAHGAFVSSVALTTFKNWVVTFGIRISWTNHFHGVWV